jgi:transcriptional regulator with XRE-family HTH domain
VNLAEQAGRILRRARGDRSLRALATEAGLAHTTLNEVEAGRNNPTLSRLERLGVTYGVRFRLEADPIEEP